MANLTPDNIVERRLLYTRQKTGKRINLPLCDEASVIIQKYMNQDETNKYIFPILHQNVHKTEMQKYNRRKKVKVPKFEKKYIKHILFLATAMMR
ncbi:MAG: hypothetical protein LBV74_14130 [Tannerella sp.]|nr:hypothetical protein [Tannerella sp.]